VLLSTIFRSFGIFSKTFLVHPFENYHHLDIFLAVVSNIIPKHKEEATDDIREKGERG
jgi:hypothetical protein